MHKPPLPPLSQPNWKSSTPTYLFFFNFILFLNFTILYRFCHISKWIRHPYLSFKTQIRGLSFQGLCSELSAAAAAAKSLQSCLTLCHPIDGSPPGFPVPGILQARTLEWVAISFSNAWKWKVKVKSLSRVRLLATPWTAGHQAPLSMGFSRQEFWTLSAALFVPFLYAFYLLRPIACFVPTFTIRMWCPLRHRLRFINCCNSST